DEEYRLIGPETFHRLLERALEGVLEGLLLAGTLGEDAHGLVRRPPQALVVPPWPLGLGVAHFGWCRHFIPPTQWFAPRVSRPVVCCAPPTYWRVLMRINRMAGAGLSTRD